MFEAFPPSPDSLDADGDNPLQLSFERARDTGLPDQMPLFHYDVLDHTTGHLEHRVWSLISAPVLDHRGRTQLVLQRVEDISDYVRERQRRSLVVGWTEERVFPGDELDLLDAFAAQCAQALDRLQTLTAERSAAEATRGLSETLQRSLLTDPPAQRHTEIAVRYLPASAGAQIGGDWYDAFELLDGDLTLVIGDVTGHDRTAAAVMGQVRNVLHCIAQVVAAPPGQVLTALDTTLHALRVESLVTAVLARVHVGPGTTPAGPHALLVQCRPPAAVAGRTGRDDDGPGTPDGSVAGRRPRAARGDHELTLPPGVTVLLYTDGLVERRGEDLDAGTERLRALVARLADLPVDRLCDALVDALGGELDDDVALLAIRFRPT